MRREYEMTEEQYAAIMKASQPVPAVWLPGGEPMFGTPQTNANSAWMRLGEELGFEWDTAKPVRGKSDRFFTAEEKGGEHAKNDSC